MSGEAGAGVGKGGGSGGSVRDAGGAMGKRQVAQEEEYFHKMVCIKNFFITWFSISIEIFLVYFPCNNLWDFLEETESPAPGITIIIVIDFRTY